MQMWGLCFWKRKSRKSQCLADWESDSSPGVWVLTGFQCPPCHHWDQPCSLRITEPWGHRKLLLPPPHVIERKWGSKRNDQPIKNEPSKTRPVLPSERLSDFPKSTQWSAWMLERGQTLNLGLIPKMSNRIDFEVKILLICPKSFW